MIIIAIRKDYPTNYRNGNISNHLQQNPFGTMTTNNRILALYCIHFILHILLNHQLFELQNKHIIQTSSTICQCQMISYYNYIDVKVIVKHNAVLDSIYMHTKGNVRHVRYNHQQRDIVYICTHRGSAMLFLY